MRGGYIREASVVTVAATWICFILMPWALSIFKAWMDESHEASRWSRWSLNDNKFGIESHPMNTHGGHSDNWIVRVKGLLPPSDNDKFLGFRCIEF